MNISCTLVYHILTHVCVLSSQKKAVNHFKSKSVRGMNNFGLKYKLAFHPEYNCSNVFRHLYINCNLRQLVHN